jgi:hypothetical protein
LQSGLLPASRQDFIDASRRTNEQQEMLSARSLLLEKGGNPAADGTPLRATPVCARRAGAMASSLCFLAVAGVAPPRPRLPLPPRSRRRRAAPRCNATPVDAAHIRRCVELASRAAGQTRPNPMVGCVLTGPGGFPVLAEGYHTRAGRRHADGRVWRVAAGASACGNVAVA